MSKPGIKNIHGIISWLIVKNNIVMHKMFVSLFTEKDRFKHLFELPICNYKSCSMKNTYTLGNVGEMTYFLEQLCLF